MAGGGKDRDSGPSGVPGRVVARQGTDVRGDSRRLAGRFLLFAGVGVVGTAAHYLVLIGSVEMAGIGPLAGSSAGFVVGALVNYLLNYRFTFRSSRRHGEALPLFYLIATVGFCFNGFIMWLLAESLGFNYVLSQVVATGLILLWTFTANSLWTFPDRQAR